MQDGIIKDETALMRGRKLIPSRETANEIYGFGLSICHEHIEPVEQCDNCKLGARLMRAAESMLFLRQAFRGGALDKPSGRYSP